MILDRRIAVVLGILLGLAVLVNLDRLAYGPAAVLRAHDVADNTVTGLDSCGEFWRSSLRSVWDPTQLRGWPRAGSPQHPQLLMCMAGGLLPPAYILPILHIILLSLIAAGSFLFVRAALERSHETAVAAAVLNVALYFFFHEHPVIPSAILLPPLVGFLSIRASTVRPRVLMFAGAAAIFGVSNPPATLILMPVGHFALILATPRPAWRAHFTRWAVFWFAYALYYGPTMAAMLREFADSSRSLYRPPVTGGSFAEIFRERLFNPAVITPAAVLLALVGRRTWRGTALLAVAILAFITLSSANQVLVQVAGERLPVLVSLSTTYYRMYYFVPVAILVWGAWILEDSLTSPARTRARHVVLAALFCVAAAYLPHDVPRVFLPYWKYALAIGAIAVTMPWWAHRAAAVAAVAAAVFVFGRYEFTRIYEVPAQGNLFVEASHLGQPEGIGRTVTVMNDCDAVDLYPAQARAAGENTIDGISNYYSRAFVERWRYFVSDNPSSCTARYVGWNTRTELTLADLTYNADRILAWLWINNVGYVRAPAAVTHPRLSLVDERTFAVDRGHKVTRYLYRVQPAVSLVFTAPADVVGNVPPGDLAAEERALIRLEAGSLVENMPVDAISGSHLRFRANVPADRAMLASINYHRGWQLLVDGRPSVAPVERGVFGMIRIPAAGGVHKYELIFRSPTTAFVPLFMLLGLGLLWVGSGAAFDRKVEPFARWLPPWRRPVVITALAGAILCAGGAALFLWTASSERAAPWLAAAWQQRLRLDTDGVPQTGSLSMFPIRVEITREHEAFWSGVQDSGADVRFTGPDGTTVLPHELERFDRGDRQMVAWVRLNTLKPGAHTLGFLYFDNPSAPAAAGTAWDSSYAYVSQAPPAAADTDLNFGDEDWTIEFKLNPAPLNGRNYELFEQGPPGAFNIYLHSGRYIVVERQNGTETSEVAFADHRLEPGVWTHLALARTGHHLRLAVNGRPVAARAVVPKFTQAVLPRPLRIGSGRYGPLDGRLADVRISRGVARSADWTLVAFAAGGPGFVKFGPLQRLDTAGSARRQP